MNACGNTLSVTEAIQIKFSPKWLKSLFHYWDMVLIIQILAEMGFPNFCLKIFWT